MNRYLLRKALTRSGGARLPTGLLLVLYVGDRFSGTPPSVGVIAWSGIIAALVFIPWAWWLDLHRTLRSEIGASGPA